MEKTDLIVGLPLGASAEDKAGVKEKMLGEHVWKSDGIEKRMTIESVTVASQPVGALFDWLLDDNGKLQAGRKSVRDSEIGIIGIGMNTVDLLVVDKLSTVERFTAGHQVGVRRLLELSNPQSLYTIAEMDEKLRAGKLDTRQSLPVWKNEVFGVIDRQWGRDWRRFGAVVLAGGGSIILSQDLSKKFGLLYQCDVDPVISTARGLWKHRSKTGGNVMAFDAGFGSIKLYGWEGEVVMPAAVSANGGTSVGSLEGLKKTARPMKIESGQGSFYVGAGAHRFGRPVQSLDLDRLNGPEMLALFYGALSLKG